MIRYLLIISLFYSIALQGQSIEPSARIGYESINAKDLKDHLIILTSDSLEGRETSYLGQKKAANYIAGIFKKLNLQPIGDSGTYFQHFDVEVTRIKPETKIVTEIGGTKRNYEWGKDFITVKTKDTIVTGPAAFVGFTDTELDSAEKAKLVGRVVFVLIGKKDYANDTSKMATMRRFFASRYDTGAIAMLMIPDRDGPATLQHAQQIMGSLVMLDGAMRMKSNQLQTRPQHIRFLVSTELAEEVIKPSGITLQQLRDQALQQQKFTPIFIDQVKVTIKSKVIYETKQTENVVGLLPGSDSDLKTQVVALTAHYDHLGISKNGVIYPGADDDGSGTAAVLQLAEAFSRNPIKPKCSLLFIMFTGEEKGLFGSQYYVYNPIIPLDRTITDLNIDMIGRLDTAHEVKKDTNYIYVIGSDKISLELDSLLRAANNESEHLYLDYSYNSEDNPEQYYRRSDHYNFAKHGVPIIFFLDGINADYHKPTDTVDKILFGRMVKIVRMIYDLGWKLANLRLPLTKKPIE